MAELRVHVDEDHLKRLVRGPMSGLVELVWNGLDADATTVSISAEKSPLDAVNLVQVTDDGLGVDPDEIAQGFGALGGSWKKTTRVTKRDKRQLHGERGQGSFAAFGLGDSVQWTTVSTDPRGNLESQIIGHRSSGLDKFDFTGPIRTDKEAGTVVTVGALPESVAKFFDRNDIADNLSTKFALYLEQYPKVAIKFRGKKLDPASLQVARREYVLSVEGVAESISLLIIEWSPRVDRALYLCTADGMAVSEEAAGIQAPNFNFTAYLKWSGFAGHDFLLAELGNEPHAKVLTEARRQLREHFKEEAKKRRRALIQDWIEEGVYPYAASPVRGSVARAEREVFEVVAYAAAETINDGNTRSKRLSLRLLKEALEASPGNLHGVLESVLDLPESKLAELGSLLQKTNLPAIISTAKIVSDRLSFLNGLDTIVFDPEPKKQTLERRQLHRILANETWIFGEEYSLTGDDESLTKVLGKHKQLLGTDVEVADGRPVLRHDGRIAIPDLVLSRTIQSSQDRLDNLVVELKRPSVVLKSAELTQISEYALAIMRDERFNRPNVAWDFWVVGTEVDELTEERRSQTGLPFGVIQQKELYSIHVVTWSEIIGQARQRLKFLERALSFSATHDDGVAYLRETHAKYLPPVLAAEDDGAEPRPAA